MDTAKAEIGAENLFSEQQTQENSFFGMTEQLREISSYLYFDSRRYDAGIGGGI